MEAGEREEEGRARGKEEREGGREGGRGRRDENVPTVMKVMF